MPELPHINIEHEFAVAIHKANGEVVETLLGKSPSFDNADYLFRDDGVVVELKCLEKDFTNDPLLGEKLSRIYRRLMDQGRAPRVIGRVNISLKQIAQFDELAAFELIEPQKQRLVKVLKKANKQIKETAAHFRVNEPKGLLLLANDGDRSLQMDLVLTLLDRILRSGRFSSINSIIYFSANMPVTGPGLQQPCQPWMDLVPQKRDTIDLAVVNRIRDAWLNRVATVTGTPVLLFKGDGRIDPANARFEDGPLPKLNI